MNVYTVYTCIYNVYTFVKKFISNYNLKIFQITLFIIYYLISNSIELIIFIWLQKFEIRIFIIN